MVISIVERSSFSKVGYAPPPRSEPATIDDRGKLHTLAPYGHTVHYLATKSSKEVPSVCTSATVPFRNTTQHNVSGSGYTLLKLSGS